MELPEMPKRMYRFRDLKSLGHPFSKAHTYRLIAVGEFPPPVKLGKNTSAWLEEEIDAWQEARIAARNN
jgi:predicted DNA-binding transcriptional regulator AlpA